MIQPLSFEFPGFDPHNPSCFMLGHSVVITGVVTPGAGSIPLALPESELWYDLHTFKIR